MYDGDTEEGQFIYSLSGNIIVHDTTFIYTEYIDSMKKKGSIIQGVVTAQIDIDGLLEAVVLGNMRYLENSKDTRLIISLSGTGMNTEENVSSTLQLRHNHKSSDKINNAKDPVAALYAIIAKATTCSIQDVEKAMSPKK